MFGGGVDGEHAVVMTMNSSKGKTMAFGVNLMRSQGIHRDAQVNEQLHYVLLPAVRPECTRF